MRIVLIGTVESTAVTLRSLCEAGHAPVMVVGLDPGLASRHGDYVDMGSEAARLGVPFFSVRSINDPVHVERIAGLEPDWLVVVGWSQICREPLLAVPTQGAIGYHPSPLPELRGRAVLAWTILLDRKETAGSLFRLEPGVDSGSIFVQRAFELDPRESLTTLMAKHMAALDHMWSDLLPRLESGEVEGRIQDETRASYCGKRTAADGLIHWDQDATSIDRLVRAVTRPYPGAFGWLRAGKLNVWATEIWQGAPYYAPPGQVLAILDDGLLVACGDFTSLKITDWSWEDPGEHRDPRVGDQIMSVPVTT